MDKPELVDRLAALPNLEGIPREEFAWLVEHGELVTRPPGKVMAPKGERIEFLWILLSGRISIFVDRGIGPRRVSGWKTGEVGGMLPYSRMTGPPGDSFVEEETELLAVNERHFPEMVYRCPVFTTHAVHVMLDRARRFNASDLQDEKMLSLGKLAAGLAHELNNPASATIRGAKSLLAGLDEADAASQALGAARLTEEQQQAIERLRAACLAVRPGGVLSPIERADREDKLAEWLARNGSDPGYADRLAETDVTIEHLDELARLVSGEDLSVVLRWIAVACETHSLAADIERASTRVHELVAAVKRFTQMDHPTGPEAVDIEGGLRDTTRVVASKAKEKGASITLDIEPDLPRVYGAEGELNQVWLNLIDNALDAIPESGRVDLTVRREMDRVVVRVVDDGPGIPAEIQPRIFDAFFTTKAPGQGLGLGLELTRRLVRRYRGDIEFDSRPGWTEFRVTLAIEKPASPTAGELQ